MGLHSPWSQIGDYARALHQTTPDQRNYDHAMAILNSVQGVHRETVDDVLAKHHQGDQSWVVEGTSDRPDPFPETRQSQMILGALQYVTNTQVLVLGHSPLRYRFQKF